MIFFNTLGGAISISVAQNVFANTLIKTVPKYASGVDPHLIIASGATQIRKVVPADQLAGVLKAYSYALDRAFILPIAVSGAALIVAFFVSAIPLFQAPI